MQILSKKTARLSASNLRLFTMLGVLLVLSVGFGAFTGWMFFTVRNISNLTRQMVTAGIIGISMTLIIVTCGIDLSAGSVMGLMSVIAAYMQVKMGYGTATSIVVVLVLGTLTGLLQGSIIAYLKMAPFIVTLGGQMVFRGLILLVTKGQTIAPFQASFRYFGSGYIPKGATWVICVVAVIGLFALTFNARRQKQRHGTLNESMSRMLLRTGLLMLVMLGITMILCNYNGLPVQVFIMLVLVLVFTFIAEKTTFGRKIFAIGGNAEAAKYAGINVRRVTMMVYVLNGFLCAITGVVYGARLNAGIAGAGQNVELDAIASAVIGGASMSGGVGKVAGALLGALIMAVIDNGMSMMNLDSCWQYIVKGLILVVAVLFDTKISQKK